MNYTIKKIALGTINRLEEFKISFKEIIASGTKCAEARKSKLESIMLITAHSLEKGQGIRNTRPGYGKKKAENLLAYLSDYENRGYSKGSFAYLESLKMLSQYIEYQAENGIRYADMETKIKDRISSLSDDEKNRLSGIRCGSYRIAKEDIIRTTNIDFSAFLSSRHSIRDFKEGLISEENIIKAIEMANKCPSACNRQPIKVYCTNTIDKSKEVDKLITGTNGFQGIIQNFMIITVDRAYFSGAEYNQWYINGGIFVSSLIMALHSLNIGSCVMQWRQFYKNERKLKSLLGIKKQDAIITIVGIGYYPDSVKVISAQRRDVEDMISFIK